MKGSRILLGIITLISCENSVRFEVPQPEGKSDESQIPRSLAGQYRNVKDSSTLVVARGLITKIAVATFSEHKSQLDSADRIIYQNDTAFSQIDSKMRIDVVVKDDSVFLRMEYRDTIFNAQRGDVLRKYKGYYFLNRQISRNSWYVTTLSKGRNGLTLATMSTKQEIERLRELTEETSDTVYSFHPSKKELRKFLKGGGFSATETFIRIPLDHKKQI